LILRSHRIGLVLRLPALANGAGYGLKCHEYAMRLLVLIELGRLALIVFEVLFDMGVVMAA
jgi:hypothetical protein